MTDLYANYAELSAAQVEGVDYRIQHRTGYAAPGVAVSHIAIHGGGIEVGTTEASDEAARRSDHYWYNFEGLKASGNSDLHLTSVNFDEPIAVDLQSNVSHTVSWHGTTDVTAGVAETFVGGLDSALRDRIITRLSAAGFAVTLASPVTYPEIAGVSPDNIANRNLTGAGVQLELTSQQRKNFFPGGDWSRSVRESGARTDEFKNYIDAVALAIEEIYPFGQVVTDTLVPRYLVVPPLADHRSDEHWVWDMLDINDRFLGTFDGVKTSNLTKNVNTDIKTGGDITWIGKQQHDWTQIRLRPTYRATLIDGTMFERQFGVYLPAAPVIDYTGIAVSAKIELYDKLLVLLEDKVDVTYSLPPGTVVTAAIRDLIVSTGEEKHSIVDSAETLVNPQVWPIGTPKLRIVNDLLSMINYFSLWCDGGGYYKGEPYVAPAYRGDAYDFTDGQASIYSPLFTHDKDYFNKPNKVILVSQGDGESPAMTSVVTNMDPDDPLSYPARGRWITVIEEGVEATSQTMLDSIAERRMDELSAVYSTIDIKHALVPLELNDVVHFANSLENIDLHGTILEQTIPCATGKLITTTLRVVR